MKIHDVGELGALIRDRRGHLGWSQAMLASKIGSQRLWVSQIESGKETAQIGLVLQALRALGVAIDIIPLDRTADDKGALKDRPSEIDLNRFLENLGKDDDV